MNRLILGNSIASRGVSSPAVAGSVAFAKMIVIPAIGLSLTSRRKLYKLCLGLQVPRLTLGPWLSRPRSWLSWWVRSSRVPPCAFFLQYIVSCGCTRTLVNPLFDQRVSADRVGRTPCRQPGCVLGLCNPTLVNLLLDQRVCSIPEEPASCRQPDYVMSLCTPTLAFPLFDQRVSAVRVGRTPCRQPARFRAGPLQSDTGQSVARSACLFNSRRASIVSPARLRAGLVHSDTGQSVARSACQCGSRGAHIVSPTRLRDELVHSDTGLSVAGSACQCEFERSPHHVASQPEFEVRMACGYQWIRKLSRPMRCTGEGRVEGRHRRHHLEHRKQKMNGYEISSICTCAAYTSIFNLPPPPTLSHPRTVLLVSTHRYTHIRPEVVGWALPV